MNPTPPDLTEEDWNLISLAPISAFLLVAAADGKIDKKEMKACSDVLSDLASQQEHPLTAKMMQSALLNLPIVIPRLLSSENPMEELLNANILINEKIGGEDAKIMKNSVLVMAKKIAEASGGFLGFGNKIDEDEKQALQLLSSVFSDDQSCSDNQIQAAELTEEESAQWYEDKSKLMEQILPLK